MLTELWLWIIIGALISFVIGITMFLFRQRQLCYNNGVRIKCEDLTSKDPVSIIGMVLISISLGALLILLLTSFFMKSLLQLPRKAQY